MTVKGILRVRKVGSIEIHEVNYKDEKGRSQSVIVPEKARYYETPAIGKPVECLVEAIGKEVSKCVIEGREKEPVITKRESGAKPVTFAANTAVCRRQPQYSGPDRPAPGTAPYNFVPYRVDAIAMPRAGELRKWSGEIICELTAQTPLLVSGKQVKLPDESTECKFMEAGGRKIIPGTAIKGMLRSLMEILSFSGLRPVSKKRLFYRDVAEERYRSLFPDAIRGGFLRKVGADFYLHETKVDARHVDAPMEAGYEKVRTGGFKSRRDGVEKYAPSYFFRLPKDNSLGQKLDPEIVMRFFAQLTPNQEGRWSKEERKRRLNSGPGLPVFFRIDELGHPADLGFCRFFRLAYEFSPYDLAWPDREAKQTVDFAQTIFGHVGKENVAGRIAIAPFEIKGQETRPVEAVLGAPKPTCLGFYIDQNPVRLKIISRGRKYERTSMQNYNEKTARLRGRKLYWHQKSVNVPPLPPNARGTNRKVISVLHPLAQGSHGTFSIRVNHLTDTELGCLFEALELRAGCLHKLGMGRSLGMGSIRIGIKAANIADVSQKYGSLADRLSAAAPGSMPREKMQELRNAFRAHIYESVGSYYKGASNYEELEPVRDLFLMLDFEHAPESAQVATMTLKQFGDNPVLPQPPAVLTGKS